MGPSAVGVEQRVSVVHEAEEDGQGLFREGEASGMVELGHLLLLREETMMAPFYLIPNPRNTHLESGDTMTEDKTRSELFGEVLVQLDSAAGEAAKSGSEELEEYIREVLIPFRVIDVITY